MKMSSEFQIQNENEFLFMLCEKKKTEEVYPKVTAIPRGHRITPDIDLLEIKRYGDVHTIGYELKLLKFNKKTMDVPFTPFYTGLGEATCYFQHGVERVHLIIGCYLVPQDHLDLLDKIEKRLEEICKLMKESVLVISPHLGIEFYRQDRNYSITLKPTEGKFYVSVHEDIQHKRECLLRKEFSWGRTWLRNMRRKQKIELGC